MRNPSAQRKAGGDRRRQDDDGGHIIGAQFNGSPNESNLFPQNLHLNRGGYKRLEKLWAKELKKKNQVFVSIHVSASNDDNREDSIYGTYMIVTSDGKKTIDSFSVTNESSDTQLSWEEELD